MGEPYTGLDPNAKIFTPREIVTEHVCFEAAEGDSAVLDAPEDFASSGEEDEAFCPAWICKCITPGADIELPPSDSEDEVTVTSSYPPVFIFGATVPQLSSEVELGDASADDYGDDEMFVFGYGAKQSTHTATAKKRFLERAQRACAQRSHDDKEALRLTREMLDQARAANGHSSSASTAGPRHSPDIEHLMVASEHYCNDDSDYMGTDESNVDHNAAEYGDYSYLDDSDE